MRKEFSRCEKVAIGGTFDRLHKGHEKILGWAFKVGRKVYIGITSNEFARRTRPGEEIEDLERRIKELRRFLRPKGFLKRAKIGVINDPYGPTLSEEFDAIVVSEETFQTALEINKLRREKGLGEMKIFIVKLLLAQDGKPISSTRIRRGEIDREGRVLPKAP